jgi:anti-sigma factor RsiW
MSVLKRDRHVTPEQLFDYLDGALSLKVEGELKRHFKTCAACRQLEAKGRVVLGLVEAWPVGERTAASAHGGCRPRGRKKAV